MWHLLVVVEQVLLSHLAVLPGSQTVLQPWWWRRNRPCKESAINHLYCLCGFNSQNSTSFECVWLCHLVFRSASLVEVWVTEVGQWITESFWVHEWPHVLWNIAKSGIWKICSGFFCTEFSVSLWHFLLLPLDSQKRPWAPSLLHWLVFWYLFLIKIFFIPRLRLKRGTL